MLKFQTTKELTGSELFTFINSIFLFLISQYAAFFTCVRITFNVYYLLLLLWCYPKTSLKQYYDVVVNTMEQVFSLLATVISVGVLVNVMTSSGVRGLIGITFITLPLFLVYALVLIFGPLAQGSLSYGSAIIIGVPIIFLFNSMGINNTVVAAALSLIFPLGDCLPPSMIVGRVTLETVKYAGFYISFLKGFKSMVIYGAVAFTNAQYLQ